MMLLLAVRSRACRQGVFLQTKRYDFVGVVVNCLYRVVVVYQIIHCHVVRRRHGRTNGKYLKMAERAIL